MTRQREALLAETFVSLADTMVRDYDVVDFLMLLSSRCVDLFDAGEAGLMLADEHGTLHVIASSSNEMRNIELFEIQHQEGPCLDCYRTGEPIQAGDLRDATEQWPNFATEALERGFQSAQALPMRLRDNVIGALNLLRVEVGPMPKADLKAAQALADVATIGLLHHRDAEESGVDSAQLQHALHSRVAIEQARGVIAERLNVDMDEAFKVLRRYSSDHKSPLVSTANAIVDRTLALTDWSPST